MKKLLFCVLAFMLVLTCASCKNKQVETTAETETETGGEPAETEVKDTTPEFELEEGYETPIIFR